MRTGVNKSAGCYSQIEGLREGRWETAEGKAPLESPLCNSGFISLLTNQEEQRISASLSCQQGKGQCSDEQPETWSRASTHSCLEPTRCVTLGTLFNLSGPHSS